MPRIQKLIGRAPKQYFKEFWALKDISFEINKGDSIGIIGRNGSGKSTLLQLICGTLAPSTGSVEVNGRIAALLELGSGFNPEFSGHENIYMYAAVLGLSVKEIDAQYEKIVSFADIGDFISQPIKTYSSGMTMRLAFSVIAHVDADVLVIDEALAVGDAIFSQKCMRFLRKFMEYGTVLFVSHDTDAVRNLCKLAVWLQQGEIEQIGASKSVAEAYLQYTLQEVYGEEQQLTAVSTEQLSFEPLEEEVTELPSTIAYETKVLAWDNLSKARGWQTGAAEILRVTMEHLARGQDGVFEGGERVRMVIEAIAHQELLDPILGFIVKDRLGQDLFGENTLAFTARTPRRVITGQTFKANFDFRLPMLPNGQYVVMASVADGDLHNNTQHHYLHDAYVINVSSSKVRWGLVGLSFEQVSLELDNDS